MNNIYNEFTEPRTRAAETNHLTWRDWVICIVAAMLIWLFCSVMLCLA